jgi:ABC-type Mn2+/Zn2+ transport system ATPase subunit
VHDGIAESALSLRDVTVRYGETLAVDGLSFSVGQGELVALVGPNGAGKSTVFRAALGLVPYRGRIVLHETRRHAVAFVPQRIDVELDFPITVGQVVQTGRRALGRRQAYRSAAGAQAVERCLVRVGLEGLERRPLETLSGGQLQRTLVARALAQEPSVMLLDEPLAGVDPAISVSLIDLFERLAAEGVAIVVTTHDLALVRERFTRCIALNTRLVGDGSPAEVLAPEGLERFFGIPVGVA